MQGYPRTVYQLASPPTGNDRSLGPDAVFYRVDDPRRTFSMTADGNWFFPNQPEPRTQTQLNGVPTAQDIACRHGFGVYLDTDRSKSYVVSTDNLTYTPASGGAQGPKGDPGTTPLIGVPSPEAVSRPLVPADNTKNLICSNNPKFTINIGLGSGFGVGIKGLFTWDGTAAVADVRSIGATNPWAALMQTGTDAYDLTGGKP